jgi:choline dehydrogenase
MESKYDYIVIGAGSSGCVVAGRLGEAGYKVLLLEAGGKDNSPWIKIPLGYSKLYNNPKVNWCYTSEPEPELNNRPLFQPRGKVLGGSGSINGMIYMRGQAQDFDSWEAQGCVGWGWKEVLPYFKKSENQQRGANEFHGVGGPLEVSDLPSNHALGEAFHSASEALGSPRNNDFNGADQVGTGYVQINTKKQRRWSTASGFLTGPAMQNITVQLGAMVKNIILKNGVATGVRWSNKSGKNESFVTKEVIVCGGVFNSPQILELSGIGKREVLEKAGVEIQHELPGVGENLQDHFGISAEYHCSKKITVNDLYNNPILGGLQLLRYLVFKTGPFADNGNYSNTFITTAPHIKTPDMMITLMAWNTGEDLKPKPFSGFTILAEHIRPKSRGSCHIKTSKEQDAPIIKFNFLKHQDDIDAAITGLKQARKIAQTAPMDGFVKSEIAPGPGPKTDAELEAHCRQNGLSLLHGAGTCRMGTIEQEDAVVDYRLRVRGLIGLRVVDASIMPNVVSANTHATAVMIGEKGAAMIIEDAKA